MDKGFANLTKLLTNNTTGVIPCLTELETQTHAYEDRLAAVEEKLALVEASDNIVLQFSPAHEAAIATMKHRVDTAAVILRQFEKKFESTHSYILHNTQLINENKCKISGIPLVDDENPFTATKNFLVQIMNITVNDGDIIVASRLPGTLTVRIDGNKVQLPPQMFVKVTPHLQRRIASNLSVLEGKMDPTDGHYYRVKQQIPDALQAMRQHFNKVVTDVQEKNKEKPVDERVPPLFPGIPLVCWW